MDGIDRGEWSNRSILVRRSVKRDDKEAVRAIACKLASPPTRVPSQPEASAARARPISQLCPLIGRDGWVCVGFGWQRQCHGIRSDLDKEQMLDMSAVAHSTSRRLGRSEISEFIGVRGGSEGGWRGWRDRAGVGESHHGPKRMFEQVGT